VPAITILRKKMSSFVDFTRSITLPGFNELPLYTVSVLFYQGIVKGSIPSRASSLAFNFFLALFPAIIFLFTLISYVPVDDFQDRLLDVIQGIMPHNAYEATRSTIEDIVQHKRGGLLSLGFIFALYFSTNGVNAMIEGFNKSYHSIETRTFLKQRIVALILTVLLSLLLMVSISTMIFSEAVLEYITGWGILKDKFLYMLLIAGKWVILLGMFFFGISFLYYFGPSRKRKWRFFSPGSTLATVLCVLVSLGFTYFVNNFGQYNKIYGSIGTLIVIMLWIYFNSVSLLVGFELNASIDNAGKRMKRKAELEKSRNAFKATIN
jgi:membrane protein